MSELQLVTDLLVDALFFPSPLRIERGQILRNGVALSVLKAFASHVDAKYAYIYMQT